MLFESYSILGRTENIKITNEQGDSIECVAKIDTGSYSSRISAKIAKDLKLPVVDQKKVKSVMATAVVTTTPETAVSEAAAVMSDRKFGALPVVDSASGKLVGMITETDLLRLLVKLLKEKSA